MFRLQIHQLNQLPNYYQFDQIQFHSHTPLLIIENKKQIDDATVFNYKIQLNIILHTQCINQKKYHYPLMSQKQTNNNNSRKQLPPRVNRGVRNRQNQDQIHQDDLIYQNLFGNVEEEDLQDESFSNQIGLRPLQTYSANFVNYNYGRGYHYFFNLDTFPRVQGSPSYALDDKNRFKYTYRHDDEQINQIPIRKLINRHYIGLPTIQTTIGDTKNLDKNVCHYYLFINEDEKYENHRLISKYKLILKHLDQLNKKNKLKEYTELEKDVLMHEVCQEESSLERKKQILENRIKILERRVQHMKKDWEFKDQMLFHFSQNQLFHNKALLKGKKLQQRFLKQRIFNRILTLKQFLNGTDQNSIILGAQRPRKFLQNSMKLQCENTRIISAQMQNRLCSSSKMIQMFVKKQQLIIFPSFIFRFGNTSRAVDSLIKSKLEKDYESGIYIYKSFIKKLFKRELNCQDQHIEQPISNDDYEQVMKNKIKNVEQFYTNQHEYQKSTTTKTNNKKQINIDNIIDLNSIQNTPLHTQVHLLPQQTKTEITLKQLMLLYCYRNISLAMQSFIDYINHDPQILKFMSDRNYDDYHYGIARFIDSHQFCILINDIRRFIKLMMNTSFNNPDLDRLLYFKFDNKVNLGYVWLEIESDQWETEKEQSDQDQQQNDDDDDRNFAKNVFNDNYQPKPSKRIKRNQSNEE